MITSNFTIGKFDRPINWVPTKDKEKSLSNFTIGQGLKVKYMKQDYIVMPLFHPAY